MKRLLSGRNGFTLLEVVLATCILSLVVAGLFQIQRFMSRETMAINDNTFANQKAIQMLEELRSLVAGSEKADVIVLDDYDNGSAYSNILTTDNHVTDANAPLSGNKAYCRGWRYLRQINVVKVPEDGYTRKVYVRVYRAKCPYDGTPEQTLAETMSILKTIKSDYVPTQVMDIYVLAIESVPGWWSTLSTLRDTVDDAISDLQSRNPGLEFRAHWITRMSYGRDPLYRPYINDTTRTDATSAPPWVHLYPGIAPDQNSASLKFYDPDLFRGRMNVEGTFSDIDGYAIADQVNHAVRYPDEERMYAAAVAAAQASGATVPEMSLRMLLEKLNSNPDDMRNAIIMNLHGELLPVPPIRNYSDAAKDPESYPYMRAVTHPERLQYTSTDTVRLRVYTYVGGADPNVYTSTVTMSTCTITFPYNYLDESSVSAYKINGSESITYSISTYTALTTTYDGTTPYVVHPSTSSTIIYLYNTPIRHQYNSTGKTGLPPALRPYGMEYIPSPLRVNTTNDTTVTKNLLLSDSGQTLAKNTARWIISIPPAAVTTMPSSKAMTFETRIGSDTATGVTTNKPENISRSYTWIGVTPPATERYQIMGDPIHCPYLDLLINNGYNWYFRAMSSTAYPGYGKAVAGWNYNTSTIVDIDVPRVYQLYRTGLLRARAIWTTMNGFSYYYYGMGGEFGSDMNPFPNAVVYNKTPWVTTGNTSTTGSVDEIITAHGTGSTDGGNRMVAKTNLSWGSKYWLGELFPDYDYTNYWKPYGNLPTGSGKYYRAAWNVSLSTVTAGSAAQYHTQTRITRTDAYGCSSFFNGVNSSTGTFKHYSVTSIGTLTSLGTYVSSMFNFPLVSSVSTPRPFTLNYTGSYPAEWSDTAYSTQRSSITTPSVGSVSRVFYESGYSASSYDASSVVQMQNSTGTAFVIVSGLDTQALSGTGPLAKYTLLAMLRTFIDGGQYSGTAKIPQLPLVQLSSPTATDMFVNPSTVTVYWGYSWLRWDQNAYTEEYSSTYSDTSQIVYNLKYSGDNGRAGSWKFMSDDTTAYTGVFDSAHALYSPTATYTWDVSSLARGSYVIRLEAYRLGMTSLHYSYDQVGLYVYR